MPYRYNGVECDTVEELRALTGYPMNQVLASNKELVANSFVPKKKVKSEVKNTPIVKTESVLETQGSCENPNHRDDCWGRKDSCHRKFG